MALPIVWVDDIGLKKNDFLDIFRNPTNEEELIVRVVRAGSPA